MLREQSSHSSSIDNICLQCIHQCLVLLKKNVLREMKEFDLCSFFIMTKL